MTKPTDSEPSTKLRSTVDEAVKRYTRNPNAVEHERLLPLVAEVYGDNVAEFFDREGLLPLIAGDFPWPMKTVTARIYVFGVLATSIVGAIAATLVLRIFLAPWVSVLIAVLFGAALWFAIPNLTKLFPPADLEERNRLVGVFNDICTKNKAAAHKRAMQVPMDRAKSSTITLAEQLRELVDTVDPEKNAIIPREVLETLVDAAEKWSTELDQYVIPSAYESDESDGDSYTEQMRQINAAIAAVTGQPDEEPTTDQTAPQS